MSGFKEDVISILRQSVLLHGEAIGWVVRNHSKNPKNFELYKYLQDNKFPVTDKEIKPVILFDYIVIDYSNLNLVNLIKAMSLISKSGVIIIEITDYPYDIGKTYTLFGTLTATKVIYEDRQYLVIHSGVDYGN